LFKKDIIFAEKIMVKIIAFLKKLKGLLKYAVYAVAAVFIVLFGISASVTHKYKKAVKEDKVEIEALQKRIDTLNSHIMKLGAMDAVSVAVTLEVKNTNVLGITNIKAEQIAHTIASYTRKEVLDSLLLSGRP
jgi:flagellar basal body-associated protein FliL